ncbi:hypothetical protein SDJN03_04962, partial [Cucurbita argyrosperma subsp. sororia]
MAPNPILGEDFPSYGPEKIPFFFKASRMCVRGAHTFVRLWLMNDESRLLLVLYLFGGKLSTEFGFCIDSALQRLSVLLRSIFSCIDSVLDDG